MNSNLITWNKINMAHLSPSYQFHLFSTHEHLNNSLSISGVIGRHCHQPPGFHVIKNEAKLQQSRVPAVADEHQRQKQRYRRAK